MNEIVSITECIESYYVAGITYTTYPIHSDIPFEDQMSAFDSPAKDEVKVIIATNAAESSVTLPNVDHVICLGLCRQIMYNQSSHRQVLTPCWISRASATQRAGRTGRVRPGNVYRLYTRHAYESYMEEFEPGEMVRIPLDAVILMLKQMLHEEVKPVLLDCIEPPPLDTIDRSFQSLHRWNFITEPADEADITTLGSFVSSLGIDLSLGSLIGIGIQFGVAAEAIEMAAVMSFPKTPFQIANPLFQDAAKYNEILCQGYISKSHFDSNLYSEPMALMNALWDYEMVSNKQKWCFYYRFAMSRLKQLVSTRNSLRKRVAEFLGIDETRLQVENPPVHMPDAKITLLRLLQVWVFSDTLIESHPTKIKVSSNGDVSISLKGNVNKLKESHLCQVLDPERHPHKIISCRDIMQSGDFCYEETLDLDQYMNSFEKRLISYMSETNTDLACCYDRNHFFLFVMDEHTNGDGIASLLESVSSDATESLLLANQYSDIKRRGILERRCGMWAVLDFTGFGDLLNETTREQKRFRKIHVNDSRNVDFVSLCDAANQALVGGEVNSIMFWDFSSSVTGKKKKKKQQERQKFSVILRGECNQIAKQDMQDLLGKDTSTIRIRSDTDTSISFQNSPNQPFPYDGKDANKLAVSCITDSSSWNRSFFQDIPEGARVLSVMASGLRRGRHRLRFVPVEASENLTNDPDATLDFGLKNEETDLNKRWRRLGTDSVVFVQVDTVPASATHSSLSLFACCSNALEIRGGGLKVEGLTLLPPNPLFLLLSLLSFGIEPGVSFNWDHKEQDDGEAKKFQNAIRWLRDRKIFSETFQDEEVNAKHRIKMAFSFHESCAEMGEELVCFPEKIDALCTLFDSVDNRLSPWESLEERALTAENLKLWRLEKKILHKEKKTIISMGNRNAIQPKRQLDGGGNTKGLPNGNGGRIKHDTEIAIGRVRKENDRDTSKATLTQSRKENKNQYEPKAVPKWQTLRTFTDETITQSRGWFATELQNGEQLPPTDFPSTNILSLLFQLYSDQILAFESLQKENKRYVSLNSENWEILSYKSENEIFYHARFTNDSIPIVPIIGRGKNKLSKWMKKHMRPNRIDDAKACVPPGVFIPTPYSGPILKDRPTLVFDSIGSALKMEAAFW